MRSHEALDHGDPAGAQVSAEPEAGELGSEPQSDTAEPGRARSGDAGEERPAAAVARPDPGLTGVPRVLGAAGPGDRGPLLICVASLHGNEPAGVIGLERVFRRLESAPHLAAGLRGRIVGFSGNRQALALGRRYVTHDLNRIWFEERIARGGDGGSAQVPDDLELWELEREISRALRDAGERRVYLFDLHTTSAPGPAFAVFDDTLLNRAFALEFPVPLVLGLEEELDGTLANYLSARGVTAVGFEAGQHDDPASVARAEAGVWIAMQAAGLLAPGGDGRVSEARRQLAAEHRRYPEVVEVRYRHAVGAADGFRMQPGRSSFEPLERGEVVASDRHGAVRTPMPGLSLMPLYQAQGEDGFFVVREVRPFWLQASAALRSLHLERWLHWLPGVRRHPEIRSAFVVDRRVARWLALELFHLLGFRRQGELGREVVMNRRDWDGTARRRRRWTRS